MRDTYRRGQAAPTPAPADDLTVLRAVVMAERAIYGSVTPTTARLLADAVAADEAAAAIAKAQEAARG